MTIQGCIASLTNWHKNAYNFQQLPNNLIRQPSTDIILFMYAYNLFDIAEYSVKLKLKFVVTTQLITLSLKLNICREANYNKL